ncbi:hypothetical protein ACB092_04G001900 [Castanea dentata]
MIEKGRGESRGSWQGDWVCVVQERTTDCFKYWNGAQLQQRTNKGASVLLGNTSFYCRLHFGVLVAKMAL